jgi:hypothetical protein
VAHEGLPKREHEALERRIFTLIRGPQIFVNGFEVNPQGWTRVREATRGERVGCEQITELVLDAGFGDGNYRQQNGAYQQRQESEQAHDDPGTTRNTGCIPTEPFRNTRPFLNHRYIH